jgi:G:T/U-mismatch repair DNA glycosylase
MPIVQHKFLNHPVSPDTEILILGTFNPDIPTGPDFFYGRPKNYLWQLLPGCWGIASLKFSQLPGKEAFMYGKSIDFADLIESVNVPIGEEGNVDDEYIDDKVSQWKDLLSLIRTLPKLKAVYFTRKTFAGIPNIKTRILAIQNHCAQISIRFCLLETPARYANTAKQQQWINTIITQITCLKA